MKAFSACVLLLGFLVTVAHAQNKISGKVTDEKDGAPLFGVNVLIEELKIGTSTNPDGSFDFNNVKTGNYSVRFSYAGHKTIIKNISTSEGDNLSIQMQEGSIDLHEVIITGNPLLSDPKNISQSILTISNRDLDIKRSSTIAEILNFQPGISVRSNGTATSRPVIRGFGNNRILILENGLRMGDLSNTSDDHGVSTDGSSAEKIEVLRGPASLLYGTNAMGGVINILTEGIPTYVLNNLDGSVNLSGSTINNEFTGNADVHYGINDFAFHANYFNRTNKDYKDGFGNKVVNSDQFSRGYQFGTSFIPSFGLAGISYSDFYNSYGIPFNTTEESEEGPIKIEMKKKELRFLLESQKLNSFINSFSLKGGYQKYEHQEISRNSGEVGTAFGLKSYSADLSFRHQPIFSNLSGAFGLWGSVQNYTVSGEEAFTPNADYKSFAAYFFEQLNMDAFTVQFGARYELNSVEIPDAVISETEFPGENKNYNSFSGSIGLVYNISDEFSIYTNLANAFRAPTIEELSSYAVHEATATFDIGERNLINEKNYGVDLGFRVRNANSQIEMSGYYNDIKNYIFRKPTEFFFSEDDSEYPFNTDDIGLPVYKYSQSDAIIYGMELKAQHDFTNNLSTTIIFDYVRGYQKDTDENLPQLPPLRFSIEERYSTDDYWAGLQWKLASEQNKTAEYEAPTKGYGLIDVYCGVRLMTGNFIHTFDVKVTNLFDQPYKDHLSSIKNFAYLPGRNIQLNYRFLF
jgi:iron complex outermembrane recepter protein